MNLIRKAVYTSGPNFNAVLRHIAGSSGSPVFNSNGHVIGVHCGYRSRAKVNYRKGQPINCGVIIDNEDHNFDGFRAVLRYLDTKKVPRGLWLREMSRENNLQVMRYTVTEI